jgi:hypothetical protein
VPGLARAGFPRDHHVETALSKLHHRLLPASPDGRMPNTRTYKLSASRAHTKASHKRARGKAPSWTPTRLRCLQAQHMHNNALVIRKPPDAMAPKSSMAIRKRPGQTLIWLKQANTRACRGVWVERCGSGQCRNKRHTSGSR